MDRPAKAIIDYTITRALHKRAVSKHIVYFWRAFVKANVSACARRPPTLCQRRLPGAAVCRRHSVRQDIIIPVRANKALAYPPQGTRRSDIIIHPDIKGNAGMARKAVLRTLCGISPASYAYDDMGKAINHLPEKAHTSLPCERLFSKTAKSHLCPPLRSRTDKPFRWRETGRSFFVLYVYGDRGY